MRLEAALMATAWLEHRKAEIMRNLCLSIRLKVFFNPFLPYIALISVFHLTDGAAMILLQFLSFISAWWQALWVRKCIWWGTKRIGALKIFDCNRGWTLAICMAGQCFIHCAMPLRQDWNLWQCSVWLWGRSCKLFIGEEGTFPAPAWFWGPFFVVFSQCNHIIQSLFLKTRSKVPTLIYNISWKKPSTRPESNPQLLLVKASALPLWWNCCLAV